MATPECGNIMRLDSPENVALPEWGNGAVGFMLESPENVGTKAIIIRPAMNVTVEIEPSKAIRKWPPLNVTEGIEAWEH